MFFQYQKNKNFEESEKVFTKYLLPVHQRFSSHKALFKQFPCLALETKIKIYTMKVIKNFEKAKNLSENENTKFEQIQISEEFLKTNDIDYENVKNEQAEKLGKVLIKMDIKVMSKYFYRFRYNTLGI